MPYVVRFDRAAVSTGPDAVVIAAERYAESYREGRLEAYRFFDGDGEEVAMVRAGGVVYIARAGVVEEPSPAPESEATPPLPPYGGET
jgi:hypothetical protein